jgi:hypothetical protein
MVRINGLQICIYEDAVKAIDKFNKNNNYLPYFMGAKFKQQHCNDAYIKQRWKHMRQLVQYFFL